MTVLDALIQSLSRGGEYNRDDQVPPAVILWPDKERQWEPLMPVLIVVGYSFQDDYLNEIMEQRMNRNTRLKVIVVSPKATEAVRRVKFLNGSPRVKTIDAGAKVALNDGHLLKCCREVTAKQADESPF
jgi:hypothetical protein